MIRKLRERGCRITRQRLMLIDIILEEECSCCKEIFYRASEKNPGIGPATVIPSGEHAGGNRGDQPEEHVPD